MSLFANPLLSDFKFQKWKDNLSDIDEARLEEVCLDESTSLTQIHEFAIELGYTGTETSVANWYAVFINKEVTGITKLGEANRGLSVQQFINNLSSDEQNDFLACANRPNITTAELYQYLCELGYKKSYSSVSQWKNNYFVEGERAKLINDIVKDCRGLNTDGILSKLITDAVKVADDIHLTLTPEDINSKEGLRILPSVYREIRGMITDQNRINFIRETHQIEQASVMWVVEKIRDAFKDTVFQEPLEEVLKGIIGEMIARQRGEKGG